MSASIQPSAAINAGKVPLWSSRSTVTPLGKGRGSILPGVGRKTAERIVVELKDKIGAAGAWEASSAQRALSPEDQKLNDAVLALMALGFKQIEAHDTVRKAQAMLGSQATIEDLVRACLKKAA
jgi:Holliday junction DNA helicase RuvA